MGSKQATAGEDLGLLIEGKHLCNQIHLSFTVGLKLLFWRRVLSGGGEFVLI